MIPRPVLARLLNRLRLRYLADRNIVGVSAGFKYVEGEAQPGLAVRFYVKRKMAKPGARTIPEEVRVGRGKRVLPTDVIEVGRIRGAGPAGSLLRTPFNRGAVSFVLPGATGPVLLTCAHVLRGDHYYASTLHPVKIVEGVVRPPGIPYVARSRWAATPVQRKLAFDCGVAQFDPSIAVVPGLAVRGRHITAVGGLETLPLGAALESSCPASGAPTLTLDSLHESELEVCVNDGCARVSNLFAVRSPSRSLKQGDSGGLVFAGTRGLGYIVAISGTDPKTGWAHSLKPAVAYVLEKATGVF